MSETKGIETENYNLKIAAWLTDEETAFSAADVAMNRFDTEGLTPCVTKSDAMQLRASADALIAELRAQLAAKNAHLSAMDEFTVYDCADCGRVVMVHKNRAAAPTPQAKP